tara:strand:+ start:4787 stop:4966 length:180 start_codon:yes stop_codon:yes gene_type:complete
MEKYIVKFHKIWESVCEVEVVAQDEQGAIAAAESLAIDEEEWTEPQLLEQYISDVEGGE